MPVRLFSILVGALLAIGFFIALPKVSDEILEFQVATVIKPETRAEDPELVFVGDIMLGRHVENLIEERSVPYLFQNMRTLLKDATLTIGNFEGVVSEEHSQTPIMGFRFSIRNKYLTDLKLLGFDVLSLANNHSFDFGTDALTYTRKICKELDMKCIGSPKGIDTTSSMVQSVEGVQVGLLALQTVTADYDEESLRKAVTYLNAVSDIQIALVHWGDEYVLTHNRSQEKLARKLIEYGFDTVIGHHPHVVQDVAIYDGKPVFYSLGNFIFDQYFSDDVQEGMVVKMRISATDVTYTLLPVTNVLSRTQPDFMSAESSEKMLERVLLSASTSPNVSIKNGSITVSVL